MPCDVRNCDRVIPCYECDDNYEACYYCASTINNEEIYEYNGIIVCEACYHERLQYDRDRLEQQQGERDSIAFNNINITLGKDNKNDMTNANPSIKFLASESLINSMTKIRCGFELEFQALNNIDQSGPINDVDKRPNEEKLKASFIANYS